MLYNVYLWPGAGYIMHRFTVDADHAESALEAAVTQAEDTAPGVFFDDAAEEWTDEERDAAGLVYVDATMEGARSPHWVDGSNLRIEPAAVEGGSKNEY